jgi:hypothetical protein
MKTYVAPPSSLPPAPGYRRARKPAPVPPPQPPAMQCLREGCTARTPNNSALYCYECWSTIHRLP